jgi:hypothetical protein
MTFSDLKKSVMDIIGEDSASPTYWTSSNDIELEEHLNDAIAEVCILTGQYTNELVLPLYASRSYYHLDAGKGGELLYLKRVRVYPEGYSLEQTDPAQLTREDYLWITRTGCPSKFYLVNGDMLRTVPMDSDGGRSLECLAVTIPPRYTEDDEVVDITTEMIDWVVSYTSYMMFITLRRLDKANLWFKKYIENSGFNKADDGKYVGRLIKLQELDAGK